MSAVVSIHQPVKISELLGIAKSFDKKSTSEKKRLEPVKVKDLLASCSKTAPSSEGRVCRQTFFIPKSGRKPVRRALYEKPDSPKQSPDRSDATRSSAVKILAKKLQRQPRKSYLPPPNSIAQRHIQKVINESIQNSTIIEELHPRSHESSPVRYDRATVITNTISQCPQYKNGEEVNQSIIVPKMVFVEDEEMTTVQEGLKASIADKENIPPPLGRMSPLTENKSHNFENFDLYLIGLCRGVITRLEKVERDLQEMKTQQTVQTDLLEKIHDLMTIRYKASKDLVSVAHVSSAPQISTEHESLSSSPYTDKKQVLSEERQRKQYNEIVQERQRSARLAAKSQNEKYDSFSALEDELHISNKLVPQKLPVNKTPKKDEQSPRAKSDRPLREYLVMKASMSFLETPEPHGFRRDFDLVGSGTSFRNKDFRRSISSKLFDELQDLYHDSPGPVPLYP